MFLMHEIPMSESRGMMQLGGQHLFETTVSLIKASCMQSKIRSRTAEQMMSKFS